jgi:peptide/nickel transport system ATP-binding protein
VMIAESLLLKPSLLIADEPTSSLDVTTQAQVLYLMRDLLRDVERRSSASIVFITHDLAVASQIGDEIVVMYAGEIVEHAPVEDLFARPMHPYTEGLLNSFPKKYKNEGRLQAISGDVPNLQNLPTGCKFHTRCKYAFKRCTEENPKLNEVEHGHKVACFLRE